MGARAWLLPLRACPFLWPGCTPGRRPYGLVFSVRAAVSQVMLAVQLPAMPLDDSPAPQLACAALHALATFFPPARIYMHVHRLRVPGGAQVPRARTSKLRCILGGQAWLWLALGNSCCTMRSGCKLPYFHNCAAKPAHCKYQPVLTGPRSARIAQHCAC